MLSYATDKLNLANSRFDRTAWSAMDGSPITLASLQQQSANERRFKRDVTIYRQGSQSKHWYEVVSGAVRLVTFLASGDRSIANFSLAGDCFGLELGGARGFAAEATTDCVLYRFPLRSLEQFIDKVPQVAEQLWNRSLKELADVQSRNAVLGRMTPPMRIASFLLDFSQRCRAATLLDLPMSRRDIADYLGLTTETLCRVLVRLAHRRTRGRDLAPRAPRDPGGDNSGGFGDLVAYREACDVW
jgi:CRP/FNR family transcriptional regulator, nitrogen fixation regulation protein